MSEQSASIGALAKALAAAQLEMKDAVKASTNPHYKSKYADLSAVRAAITGPLAKHGLAVIQTNEPHGKEGVCVVTTLAHESGEWIKGKLFVPVTKPDAQGFGSALTYARRYALAEIAGIASDEDDDAEAAVARKPENGSTPKPTDDQEATLTQAFDSAKTPDDIARVEALAAKAVQAGALSGTARARLREHRAKAVQRVAS